MKLTIAGESHGKAICGIISNVPAGLKLEKEFINSLLSERCSAFGRSERQLFENDEINIISGVRGGYTLGNNISFLIENAAHNEHKNDMGVWQTESKPCVTAPRAGHADLSGCLKYGFTDITDVSEGASARSTCAIAAGGAVALSFLSELGINIYAGVRSVGDYVEKFSSENTNAVQSAKPPMYLLNKDKAEEVKSCVLNAKQKGDTLGGSVVLVAKNVKAGFGGYCFEKRVNGLIASLLMQMQAVRGVCFGDDPFVRNLGSERVDEIRYDEKSGKFLRTANHSGGIEGGMTNGEDIIITVGIRAIPTLRCGVTTTDIITKQPVPAATPRGDVTAVFAACPILKGLLALALSEAVCERLGCDNMQDIRARYNALP